MRSALTCLAIAAPLGMFAQIAGNAQMQDNREKTLTCENSYRGGEYAHHCEIREQTMAAVGRLGAEGRNGGVTVKGWLQNQVLVRARVDAWSKSDSEAAFLASRVRVDANTGQVMASGPDSQGESGWSVSYEIFLPQVSDLDLMTKNGGISISDVRGRLQFNTKNGGVTLTRVAGDVSGSTVNDGVHVELAGPAWDGRQLEVSTKNGGVTLAVPANYSAQVRTETMNGRVSSDLPTPLPNAAPQANRRSNRNLEFTLGSGGPLIHLSTNNGGITMKKL